MGKFGNYLLMMAGLVLLFYFAGYVENTGTSVFLNFLLSPESFQTSSLVSKVVAALSGIGAIATIVVGFTVNNAELAAMGPPSILFFNLSWDFVQIVSVISAVNPVLSILLFGPFLLLWIATVLEWWRGVTT